MKTNIFDRVSDKVNQRFSMAAGRIKENFKSSNPYRQEPVEPRQVLLEWESLPPEAKLRMRQELGSVEYDRYEIEMDTLRRRYTDAR